MADSLGRCGHSRIRTSSRNEPVWRSAEMGRTEKRGDDGAVVSEYHEVSAVAALSDDDARPRVTGSCSLGEVQQRIARDRSGWFAWSRESHAHYLRARPTVL